MALELLKLLVTASTTTDVNPTATRLFYTTIAPTAGGATLTIDAASFLQDNGTNLTTLPVIDSNTTYYNVFINGLLQMEDIFTYTPGGTGVGSLAIDVPAGPLGIPSVTPIILEIVTNSATSSTTVET